MKVLIDNGHGEDTLGKRSPDGALLEYKWTRELAIMLERELTRRGVDCQRIVPEETDVPLKERCKRANRHCTLMGAKNVLLVSIHVNAAKSDGKWHDACGFSVFVANNASDTSKELAKEFTRIAKYRGLTGNRYIPDCQYWTGNFAIVRDTKCPAVLTENLFQDNEEDVNYLMSYVGKRELCQLHADAICSLIAARS